MDDTETHTAAPQRLEPAIVRFETCTGDGVDVAVDVIMQNSVLKMLYQYTCTTYPPVIHVDDDTQVFHNLIRRLEGEHVALLEKDMGVVLLQLRCAHKYQYYLFATEILQLLVDMCRSHNVLHLYSLLSGLPELPSIEDSTAPSAPPIVDLQQSDPEQAAFSDALLHAYQHCLQLIDTRSADVLASDALLSVPAEPLCQLTRRDTISARELEVGRALLRWTRHHTLNFGLTESLRRRVVLGSLRLLTMTVKDLRRLELDRYGVLTRDELGAVLDFVLHGSGDLPMSLDEYRNLWLLKRTGPKELRRGRGILHRLATGTRVKSGPPWLTDPRTDTPAVRRVHFEGQDDTDAAERREATLERRHRRTEKLKMALATGASILFD